MAIIESLALDLKQNMTVLTGETGAGKSIIIDAISLLLGDRASTDLIRHHEEMAVIEGVFEVEENMPLKEYLSQLNMTVEDQLVIKRTIKRVGNGQIRVNGELLSVTQLKEIGQYLVDIHVQHDTHRLFHNEYNYQLIDRFDVTHEAEKRIMSIGWPFLNIIRLNKTISLLNEMQMRHKKEWILCFFKK